MTEQTLSPGLYQIPILVKDSYNRACELPQVVQLEACSCDNSICLDSSTTGIYTGDVSSVTDDIYVSATDDQVEESNGLGPGGIGMIATGALLLLCKYSIKSFQPFLKIASLPRKARFLLFSVTIAMSVCPWK
jgi:hypothetical protein